MLPSQFWEEEPADTLLFIEQASLQQQRDLYNGAYITASMFGITLANAFRGKGTRPTPYPSFYEVYGLDDPTKKKVSALEKRINQLRSQFALSRGKKDGSNR